MIFWKSQNHMVRDEDFIGSVYQVEYMIHESRLRKGRNFGEILVKGPYQTLVYQVMVSRDKEVQVNISALEKQQRVRIFPDLPGIENTAAGLPPMAE